jgi:hypothetical protein
VTADASSPDEFCSWCVERPEDGPCEIHNPPAPSPDVETVRRDLRLQIEERIERLGDVAERWDVPGGSKRLAQRARDKAEGLRVARRLLAAADAACPDWAGACQCTPAHDNGKFTPEPMRTPAPSGRACGLCLHECPSTPAPSGGGALTDDEADDLICAAYAGEKSCSHNAKPLLDTVESILAARAGLPEPSGIDVDRLNREHPLDGGRP